MGREIEAPPGKWGEPSLGGRTINCLGSQLPCHSVVCYLSVVATSGMRSPQPQVIAATDGFTGVALGIRIPPVVVVSHDVFERGKVGDPGLVSSEDLGSWTEVIGELLPVPLPHHPVATEVIDISVERNVVGRPIAQTQGLSLIRMQHQPRDLFHHGQCPLTDTVVQRHSVEVQHQILAVIGS